MNLFPRLYDCSLGSVKVFGHDVKDYSQESLRFIFGVVPQNGNLFSGTVRSNLFWGNDKASDEDFAEALKIACAYDFVIEKGGLDQPVAESGRNFSGRTETAFDHRARGRGQAARAGFGRFVFGIGFCHRRQSARQSRRAGRHDDGHHFPARLVHTRRGRNSRFGGRPHCGQGKARRIIRKLRRVPRDLRFAGEGGSMKNKRLKGVKSGITRQASELRQAVSRLCGGRVRIQYFIRRLRAHRSVLYGWAIDAMIGKGAGGFRGSRENDDRVYRQRRLFLALAKISE